MKKEDIHFGDVRRWIFGEAPPEFMLEVVLRSLLIYLFLLIVLKLMGKRMAGQSSFTELSVIITLGAIVSPVMQMPDKGILYGIAVLSCSFIFQTGINFFILKIRKVELATQGEVMVIVTNGIINQETQIKTRITNNQLFALLRQKKVQNLGNVHRAYLEAGAGLSVFLQKEPRPGLPVLPAGDEAIAALQESPKSVDAVCIACGNIQIRMPVNSACSNCAKDVWLQPSIAPL